MWPSLDAGEVGRIQEIEGEDFAVGGNSRLHAGLIARAAVMGEHEVIRAVELEHGDHVLMTHAEDFAHHGRTAGGVAKGNFHRLALAGLPFPGSVERFDVGKGFCASD
jgi:hypothetical protein